MRLAALGENLVAMKQIGPHTTMRIDFGSSKGSMYLLYTGDATWLVAGDVGYRLDFADRVAEGVSGFLELGDGGSGNVGNGRVYQSWPGGADDGDPQYARVLATLSMEEVARAYDALGAPSLAGLVPPGYLASAADMIPTRYMYTIDKSNGSLVGIDAYNGNGQWIGALSTTIEKQNGGASLSDSEFQVPDGLKQEKVGSFAELGLLVAGSGPHS